MSEIMRAWNNASVSDEECLSLIRKRRDELHQANMAGNCRIGADKAIQVLDDMIFSLEARINVSGGKDE